MATEFYGDDEVLDTSHGPFWMPPEHVACAGLDALLADRPRLIPGWRVRAAAMLGSAAPMMLFRPVAAATLRRRRRREARP
jgi:short-subunit dehydrogenase